MTHTFTTKPKQSARPVAVSSQLATESRSGRRAAQLARPSAEPGTHSVAPAHLDATRISTAALPLRLSQIPVHPGAPPATSRSNGLPLDAGVRARYEDNLGRDLADVRVHTGAQAADSAASLHAEAFTIGRDIVFGAGRYRPGSPAGERLLAHELAHVAQQDSSSASKALLAISRPGDPAERAADHAAGMLLAGQPAHLAPQPRAIHRQQVGETGPGAEPLVLIRQWLETHQFAPPVEQPREGEQHVLLNGEEMPLSQAVRIAAEATHQPAETVRGVINSVLLPRMPRSLTGAPFVGPGKNVPGLPLMPRSFEDNIALGKASELDTIDSWLDSHGFGPPEIRDPIGDQVVLDGQNTTMERVADRALGILGQYPYLRRQEVLVHLRQKYVQARGGPTTQVVFGYTLVPRRLQGSTAAADPLNPTRTQHQFSFTITRAHHAGDSPGLESSFQGSVAFDDTGHIVNLQAGGQEAVVLPLLNGWIQVSGLVQVMVAANWSNTVTGTAAVNGSIQAAAGGQILITPNFREGPLQFLNGHVQVGVQALGTVTGSSSGVTAGGNVGLVVNIPFNIL